jgi:2-polyprenyl-6-methoxyphenol hydroxylase-like FAD-dependent oxidoreductase
MSASLITDVVIVGAGLAGASAAAVLGRKGMLVTLIDQHHTYPACFKAEKIEPDQAELFRKLGFMEGLLTSASRIYKIKGARGDQAIRTIHLEQYGIFYQNMVNGVLEQIPSCVARKTARIESIATGPDVCRVKLMGGETITTRLVVLACGTGGNLHASLGIRKNMIQADQSFSIGFNITPENELPFTFDSLTYYPDEIEARIGFLTLFPIRNVMRANLFVYRSPKEGWVKRFKKDPHEELMRVLPGLCRFTGAFQITSRVEMCPVDLYRVEGHIQPGLVLIGDAYQSVCPTTGMGLSKVLTDVDVLCDCVPGWLKTSGMDVVKIARFYDDPLKKACDDKALRKAMFFRTFSTNPSLHWHIYRELKYLGKRLLGSGKLYKALRNLGDPKMHK